MITTILPVSADGIRALISHSHCSCMQSFHSPANIVANIFLIAHEETEAHRARLRSWDSSPGILFLRASAFEVNMVKCWMLVKRTRGWLHLLIENKMNWKISLKTGCQ